MSILFCDEIVILKDGQIIKNLLGKAKEPCSNALPYSAISLSINKSDKVSFKYVNKAIEEQSKKFIINQYHKYYEKRISISQYDILYEKMGLILSNKKENAFFIAQNEKEEIIAAISASKYDNRILDFKERYQNKNIAEVGHCYVKKEYQRRGVASTLFKLAYNFAKEKAYEKLYLHTHYFLPGGFQFWQKIGFAVTLDVKDKLQTVHMEKNLLVPK